jgi:hypothetical protein
MTTRSLVSLVVIAAVDISPVSCFSARLSRPWEQPLLLKTPMSSSLAWRRRSWKDSALQSSSRSAQDSDDASSTDEEEQENMSLLRNGNDTASVPISQPTKVLHTISEGIKTEPTVRSSLRLLFAMTRPFSNVGVALFHILGVYLALQSPNVRDDARLLSTLTHPSMFIVLLCLLLTSATSMVVRSPLTLLSGGEDLKSLIASSSLYRLMIISIIRWALILKRFTNPW